MGNRTALLPLFNAKLSPKRHCGLGVEIPRRGVRGRLSLAGYCHHQNDSRIKTGSDESRAFECFIDCEGQSHKDRKP